MPGGDELQKLSGLLVCLYLLRNQFGIAWLVIVAVEMLTGGIGIGFFVWDEWSRLNLSSVFLAVLVIGLTGLLLTTLWVKLRL